jgi:Rieske Fe-S protein
VCVRLRTEGTTDNKRTKSKDHGAEASSLIYISCGHLGCVVVGNNIVNSFICVIFACI